MSTRPPTLPLKSRGAAIDKTTTATGLPSSLEASIDRVNAAHGGAPPPTRVRGYDAREIGIGLLKLAALILLLLFLDGSRRAYQEFSGHVATAEPGARLSTKSQKSAVAARPGQSVSEGDLLVTDPRGSAAISFPDGSALLVKSASRLELRLCDYSRTGKRDRSFLLGSGNIVSRLSTGFGTRGQMLIATPHAITAARGTAGYTVTYENGRTTVEVVAGTVALRTTSGRVEIPPAHRGSVQRNGVPHFSPMDRSATLRVGKMLAWLKKQEGPANPLLVAEGAVLRFVDPPLQMLGFTPHGWDLRDTDDARRAAAKSQLRRLGTVLTANEPPDTLNPISLSELSLEASERERILSAFAGLTLDSYERRGAGYLIRARARDGRGSGYVLTEGGVREM